MRTWQEGDVTVQQMGCFMGVEQGVIDVRIVETRYRINKIFSPEISDNKYDVEIISKGYISAPFHVLIVAHDGRQALGHVSLDGTLLRGSGISSVSSPQRGHYSITVHERFQNPTIVQVQVLE